MMIATNVELFLRHGNRGRYNPREEHEKADSEEVARKARPKPSVGHAPLQASTDLLDQESTEELTTEEQEKKAEEKEKRTAAQAEKRANKKRQLVLEGKELLGFRK